MSFKRAREELLYALDNKLISDLFMSYNNKNSSSKNLDLPYQHYARFNLYEMEEDECLAEFRVRKCDLPVLADVLGIPDKFICDQRSVVGGMEGLCMLLKRLAYPCRCSDMMARFGQWQVPVLSMATNCVLEYIYDKHHHRIIQWNHGILNPAALQTYADRIHQMGTPLDNCFGFIDGTV
ncbi:hypothetical protein ABVT39_011989 [Epinephelus coioides]